MAKKKNKNNKNKLVPIQVDGSIPQDKIFKEIILERKRQDEKFGLQDHSPHKWAIILGEEYGEICKAIIEKDGENYREELIQLASACVAALENLEQKNI